MVFKIVAEMNNIVEEEDDDDDDDELASGGISRIATVWRRGRCG